MSDYFNRFLFVVFFTDLSSSVLFCFCVCIFCLAPFDSYFSFPLTSRSPRRSILLLFSPLDIQAFARAAQVDPARPGPTRSSKMEPFPFNLFPPGEQRIGPCGKTAADVPSVPNVDPTTIDAAAASLDAARAAVGLHTNQTRPPCSVVVEEAPNRSIRDTPVIYEVTFPDASAAATPAQQRVRSIHAESATRLPAFGDAVPSLRYDDYTDCVRVAPLGWRHEFSFKGLTPEMQEKHIQPLIEPRQMRVLERLAGHTLLRGVCNRHGTLTGHLVASLDDQGGARGARRLRTYALQAQGRAPLGIDDRSAFQRLLEDMTFLHEDDRCASAQLGERVAAGLRAAVRALHGAEEIASPTAASSAAAPTVGEEDYGSLSDDDDNDREEDVDMVAPWVARLEGIKRTLCSDHHRRGFCVVPEDHRAPLTWNLPAAVVRYLHCAGGDGSGDAARDLAAAETLDAVPQEAGWVPCFLVARTGTPGHFTMYPAAGRVDACGEDDVGSDEHDFTTTVTLDVLPDDEAARYLADGVQCLPAAAVELLVSSTRPQTPAPSSRSAAQWRSAAASQMASLGAEFSRTGREGSQRVRVASLEVADGKVAVRLCGGGELLSWEAFTRAYPHREPDALFCSFWRCLVAQEARQDPSLAEGDVDALLPSPLLFHTDADTEEGSTLWEAGQYGATVASADVLLLLQGATEEGRSSANARSCEEEFNAVATFLWYTLALRLDVNVSGTYRDTFLQVMRTQHVNFSNQQVLTLPFHVTPGVRRVVAQDFAPPEASAASAAVPVAAPEGALYAAVLKERLGRRAGRDSKQTRHLPTRLLLRTPQAYRSLRDFVGKLLPTLESPKPQNILTRPSACQKWMDSVLALTWVWPLASLFRSYNNPYASSVFRLARIRAVYVQFWASVHRVVYPANPKKRSDESTTRNDPAPSCWDAGRLLRTWFSKTRRMCLDQDVAAWRVPKGQTPHPDAPTAGAVLVGATSQRPWGSRNVFWSCTNLDPVPPATASTASADTTETVVFRSLGAGGEATATAARANAAWEAVAAVLHDASTVRRLLPAGRFRKAEGASAQQAANVSRYFLEQLPERLDSATELTAGQWQALRGVNLAISAIGYNTFNPDFQSIDTRLGLVPSPFVLALRMFHSLNFIGVEGEPPRPIDTERRLAQLYGERVAPLLGDALRSQLAYVGLGLLSHTAAVATADDDGGVPITHVLFSHYELRLGDPPFVKAVADPARTAEDTVPTAVCRFTRWLAEDKVHTATTQTRTRRRNVSQQSIQGNDGNFTPKRRRQR